MAETTAIEWTDASCNIWRGCAKVAPGCANCYAEALERRFGTEWGKGKPRVYCKTWLATLERLDRKAAREGRKLKVFINSHSDFFEDHDGPIVDNEGRQLFCDNHGEFGLDVDDPLTLDSLRSEAFQAFDRLQNLILILLTKRPENIRKMWPSWPDHACLTGDCDHDTQSQCDATPKGYRDNVWLLTSVSEQESANRNIPELLKCRDLSPVLGVSAEPLLGAVDFTPWMFSSDGFVSTPNDGPVHREDGGAALDWVIVGGESGPNARPNHIAWARNLVRQCRQAGVPCFVKQLGARITIANDEVTDWPNEGESLVQLTESERFQGAPIEVRTQHTKGGEMSEWPEDLRVREFPVLTPESAEESHG